MPLEPGARLGVYLVGDLLAAGGMGEVYRGRDERLGRDVAIKIIAEGLASEEKELARFERETRILASLSHPNILNIFDVGEHEGTQYAVMELLRGENLRERMAKRALPWRTATAIAVAVARGLAAAHSAGIIHRDLKPENVFLLADGGVKVLDFGLAHQEVPPTEGGAAVGEAEAFVGTAIYMSPEQICGETADARTDIFGLGVLLYEMLTGTRPFGRLTVGETMSAILHAEPPPMSAFGANVPTVLEHIVRRCLEKDRGARVQAAYDLAFGLNELLWTPPGQGVASSPIRARIGWFLAGALLGAAVTLLLIALR